MDLSNSELNPVDIYRWLDNTYRQKWILWEPSVLAVDLQDKQIKFSYTNFQVILALRLLAASNRPWQETDIFEKTVLALNDVIIHPGVMEDVSPQQMAFAVECMKNINPSNEFSDDVRKYIAAKCFEYNLLYMDPPLAIANEYLNKLIEKRPELQQLQNRIKTERNKSNIKDDALKFQISELNTIGEYIRRRYGNHKYK